MTLHETIEYLSTFLVIIPLIIFCFIPVQKCLKNHWANILRKVVSLSAAYFIIILTLFFIYHQDFGNILLFGALPVFFYFYQRELTIPPFAAWFVMTTACVIGGLSYIFAHIIDACLYPDNTYLNFSITASFAQIGFLIVADLILYYPTKKYLGWLVQKFSVKNIWRVIWIFPAVFTLASISYIPHEYHNLHIGRMLQVFVSIYLIFILFIFLFYFLFYHIAYEIIKNKQMMEQQKILEIQSEQYKQLSDHIQQTRQIRHDFRHQLTVIAELANNKQFDDLQTYLNQYTASLSDTMKIYCRQPAINAILNHYDFLCHQNKISAQFAVHIPEHSGITEMDFCILLGNLLENATLACMHQNDSFIHLKAAQTAPHAFVLIIENPYLNQIRKKGDEFLSSRHDGMGIGLRSIATICEKYQGTLEIRHENHLFQVKIFLQD